MDYITSNFLPESVNELYLLGNKITKDADFVEVPTKSPRFSDLKSVIPVFVIPGFKPKIIDKLYAQFFYPVFEARLPEKINSIGELAEMLVNVSANRVKYKLYKCLPY